MVDVNDYWEMFAMFPAVEGNTIKTRSEQIAYTKSLESKSHMSNYAFYTKSDSNSISDLIEATIEYFSKDKCSFTWEISEQDKPENLGELLLERGFTVDDESYALSFDLTELNIKSLEANLGNRASNIRIEKVPMRSMATDLMISFLSEFFPLERQDVIDTNNMLTKAVESSIEVDSQNYLAYNEEGALVAWSAFFTDSRLDYALLGGAVTHSDHRKQGLYQSLLLERLQDLKALGKKSVIIGAKRTTSAPILMKRGFQKVADLVNYKFEFNETK